MHIQLMVIEKKFWLRSKIKIHFKSNLSNFDKVKIDSAKHWKQLWYTCDIFII